MSRPPTLISQSATASFPDTKKLDELVLWDYTFNVITDDESTFAVILNEGVTTETAPPPIVRSDDVMRTIVYERLDVRNVQCARGSAEGLTFAAPAAPTMEISGPVMVGSVPASITSHLTSLVAALVGSLPITMEIRCFYISLLNGMPVAVPVVLVSRQDVTIGDAALFEQIESTVHQWLDVAQPPLNAATLSVQLTLWSTVAGIEAPLLRIADASLPMSAGERPTRL